MSLISKEQEGEIEPLMFLRNVTLTRAHPGGVGLISAPPSGFFADNAKTAARSAAALGIAVHSSFPHIVSKFWPRVMSGQVSRSR